MVEASKSHHTDARERCLARHGYGCHRRLAWFFSYGADFARGVRSMLGYVKLRLFLIKTQRIQGFCYWALHLLRHPDLFADNIRKR